MYKRQDRQELLGDGPGDGVQPGAGPTGEDDALHAGQPRACLLYTSDAADERYRVELGGRRIIKKEKKKKIVDFSQSISTAYTTRSISL